MKFTPKRTDLVQFTDSCFQRHEHGRTVINRSATLRAVFRDGKLSDLDARGEESEYALNGSGSWSKTDKPALHAMRTGTGASYSARNDTDYREAHIGGPYNWRRIGDPESQTVWRELRKYPEAELCDWLGQVSEDFVAACLESLAVEKSFDTETTGS